MNRESNKTSDQTTIDQSLPKILMPLNKHNEQISNSSPLLKDHSPSAPFQCHQSHQPERATRAIIIDSLIKLVNQDNSIWDINYFSIRECMKRVMKYSPKYDILFEDEKQGNALGNAFDSIKTSLTKRVNPKAFHRSNSNCPKRPFDKGKEPDYAFLIMNKKQKEQREFIKKLQIIDSSFTKQRLKNRGNTIALMPIPMELLRKKNKECIRVNQYHLKKRIDEKAENISGQIHILRRKILDVLDQNLVEFKKEMNKESKGKDNED